MKVINLFKDSWAANDNRTRQDDEPAFDLTEWTKQQLCGPWGMTK
jgi:hypothetical protein